MADMKPVQNAAGTHVYVTTPSGDPWECPLDYLEIALRRGFELAEAPEESLADPVMEPAPKKKSAAKTSGD